MLSNFVCRVRRFPLSLLTAKKYFLNERFSYFYYKILFYILNHLAFFTWVNVSSFKDIFLSCFTVNLLCKWLSMERLKTMWWPCFLTLSCCYAGIQLLCRLDIDTYDVAAVALYCIFIETCCLFTADSLQHIDSNRDHSFLRNVATHKQLPLVIGVYCRDML